MPVIKTPVTVVDQHGKILVWHLPDVLSPEHQIWDNSAMLNQVLKSHHPQSEGNWRMKSEYYMNEDQCEQFLPGCINLSPAWFQQGHESMSFNPEICSVLKKPDSVSRVWLQRMRETSALIGGIMSIIHPELYRSGMASLRGMQWLPGVNEVLKEWHLPFNAMSFIANRESPSHRDWKAMACWYDILVTIGNFQDLTLDLEGVGVRLAYPSGTITALSGRTILHRVVEKEEERICLAYYMRTEIHERAEVSLAGWMSVDAYDGV
ncbi:hypothetical protein AcV7_001922 [Taiwanofungus camphoratus]|nr:hypothetical protein AcV7_001922 [Antrodia cinnamomea]